MALERLIKRIRPENLTPGRVTQVDPRNRQIRVTMRGMTISAAYDPSAYPSIAIGDDLLIGRAGASYFIVGTAPKATPTRTHLLGV